jgi:4-hydroxy-tetrahydrodipicolinate reductase
VRVAVHGASGRMGQAVVRLAASEGATIVGAMVSRGSETLGRDAGEAAGAGQVGVEITADTASGLLGADVVIDFSTPAALPLLLQLAARAKVAVVSGTTRLDATCERLLDETAKVVPVLWAPNTSVGVQVLAELVTLAAQKLGLSFDVEIVEAHHRAKVDAPSGTAERLRRAVTVARAELRPVYGREGNAGPRRADEIAVLAIRGGDVIGDHSVHFLGQGERIELSHRATNRDLFARGALAAARYVHGRGARRVSQSHRQRARVASLDLPSHTRPPPSMTPGQAST